MILFIKTNILFQIIKGIKQEIPDESQTLNCPKILLMYIF